MDTSVQDIVIYIVIIFALIMLLLLMIFVLIMPLLLGFAWGKYNSEKKDYFEKSGPLPSFCRFFFNMLKIERPKEMLAHFILSAVILACIISFIVAFDKDASDKIQMNLDGNFTLTEAKSFINGIWFNKDKVTISDKEFIIEKNTLWSNKEKIRIPTKKIKEVILEQGSNSYALIIKSEGRWSDTSYKFYIKSSDTFKTVRLAVISVGTGKFTISETL